jgi:hypothetical protein
MRKVSAVVLAAAVVAVFAVGCSSSKKSSNASASSTTSTTAPASQGGSTTTAASGSGGTGGSGSALTTAECIQASAAYAKMIADAGAAATGASKADINTEYDALGAKIPDSLKSDYKTIGDTYTKFEQDVKGASVSNPLAYAKAAQDLNDSGFKSAVSKVSAYFSNHCQST